MRFVTARFHREEAAWKHISPAAGTEPDTSMSHLTAPYQAHDGGRCNEVPPAVTPQPSSQQMFDLTLWRHASPASIIFSNWEGKKITHQRSATSQGRVGFSTTYPLSDLSFALLVFQGKKKKKKSPKTLIPGEVKRKLIFTIKFFYR